MCRNLSKHQCFVAKLNQNQSELKLLCQASMHKELISHIIYQLACGYLAKARDQTTLCEKLTMWMCWQRMQHYAHYDKQLANLSTYSKFNLLSLLGIGEEPNPRISVWYLWNLSELKGNSFNICTRTQYPKCAVKFFFYIFQRGLNIDKLMGKLNYNLSMQIYYLFFTFTDIWLKQISALPFPSHSLTL